MACQPAVNVGIFLVVTLQAHAHAPLLVRQPLLVFNLTVAFPAGDLDVNMTLVVKQHVFGHIVYFHPGRWRLGVEILMLFLDLRMFFNNIVVAVQTFFHRRNSRKV